MVIDIIFHTFNNQQPSNKDESMAETHELSELTSSSLPATLNESPTDANRYSLLCSTLLLLTGYIGYYLCRGNLSVAFPLLSREFHFSNTELGLIAFYSEIFYTLGKFINGPLTDRYGGKFFFLLGMLGAIIFNVAFSQAHSLTAFIILWCEYRKNKALKIG
jgi:sugar phosphate permease